MMSKEELKLYLNGDMENIGKYFPNFKFDESTSEEQKRLTYMQWEESKPNNHHYAINQKYVHFFKNLKYMDYIQFERNFEYLTIFDIPMVVLMSSKGKGFYKKFDNRKLKYKSIREFAIKAKDIKAEYFLGYEEIEKYEPNLNDYQSLLKNGVVITSQEEFEKTRIK